MSNIKTPRIDWIDIAKGVGILLVILGHSVQFGGRIHNFIFSFHMPLFFILSGLVYRYSNNKEFINKKVRTLILPYISFYIIGIVISLIIPSWRNGLSVKAIVKDIYLANPNAANVSSIWFLICLFITGIIFNYIQKFNIKTQYVIISTCLVAGIVYPRIMNHLSFLPECRLPFNIDVMFVAIFFFAIGVWVKNYIINIKLFLISCALFIVAFLLNGRVNLHGLTFNNPILYIVESFCGTIVVIYLCYIFSQKIRADILKNIIKWIGKHSLIILGIQAILVRLYVLLINMMENTEYILYGLPKRHQIICFISVTLVSVVICLVYDFVKVRRTNE